MSDRDNRGEQAGSPGPRTILHVDLDAFYASVEERDDPTLRGKAVIVGGHSRRGVVCAASYEARRFGVKSAMSMVLAHKLCPHAEVRTPRMSHYAEVSQQFFDILMSYTPLVQGLSLDEAFLDVTGARLLFGDGVEIAKQIKRRVREELCLVASVGVAPSKFVAKIASDLKKPDGLVLVGAAEVLAFLHPLPVSRLWGVGRVTNEALQQLGIVTIGDVANTPLDFLRARVGQGIGSHLYNLALGRDDRDVETDNAPVSIGHEDTFEEDCFDPEVLRTRLLGQADRVASRLRRNGLRAGVVTVKIKYADHARITRQRVLARATYDGSVLARAAASLLKKVPEVATRGVRLCGVSVGKLTDQDAVRGPPGQLGLFAQPAALADAKMEKKGEALGVTMDTIKTRFGDAAIIRATFVSRDKPNGPGRRQKGLCGDKKSNRGDI